MNTYADLALAPFRSKQTTKTPLWQRSNRVLHGGTDAPAELITLSGKALQDDCYLGSPFGEVDYWLQQLLPVAFGNKCIALEVGVAMLAVDFTTSHLLSQDVL